MRSAPRRRVAVIGGGPAGLEAAVVAAQRGHEVTLFESDESLGGQLRLIVRNTRREEFNRIVEWRVAELERLDVRVLLGHRGTVDEIVAERPDRVIVATGSRPSRSGWYPSTPSLPALEGHDRAHVITTWDALSGACDGAAHVVVIDAHGYHHTTDVVEYLAVRNIRTTAITAAPIFAAGIDDHDRPDLLRALRDHPVDLVVATLVESIGADSVIVRDTYRGDRRVIDGVDRVVLSFGQDPVDDLFAALSETGLDVRRAGDCVAPRGIEHAVFEGHGAGREV
jgi:NADPH-dependent 2,4-dienoyl-CoA reductase/sulfur reductase-like enzyme